MRVPAISYRLRPWAAGTPQSLLCMLAALAVCAALLLAPLLCVAHCALLGSTPHAHEHHSASASANPAFHCALHNAQPEQPAPQLPRAVYELLPLTGALAIALTLLVRALPLSGLPLASQNDPLPLERPPIG